MPQQVKRLPPECQPALQIQLNGLSSQQSTSPVVRTENFLVQVRICAETKNNAKLQALQRGDKSTWYIINAQRSNDEQQVLSAARLTRSIDYLQREKRSVHHQCAIREGGHQVWCRACAIWPLLH